MFLKSQHLLIFDLSPRTIPAQCYSHRQSDLGPNVTNTEGAGQKRKWLEKQKRREKYIATDVILVVPGRRGLVLTG
ncbi:hypothetical protein RRG08_041539 [Elysia crispata]|uniref:Uncharacterized protein n=1 Tax=Elysia crispata TaxID=231223 RepID=A0AAE0ZVV3_9GAST|nr:hypothetical protein RRG08_041539 [Elysia crispata]